MSSLNEDSTPTPEDTQGLSAGRIAVVVVTVLSVALLCILCVICRTCYALKCCARRGSSFRMYVDHRLSLPSGRERERVRAIRSQRHPAVSVPPRATHTTVARRIVDEPQQMPSRRD